MISEGTYAAEQLRLGHRIHLHDTVWWERVSPFYCKPAFEFRTLIPGDAKPCPRESFLGFSHHVPSPGQGNRTIEYMILEGPDLRTFSLEILPPKKRNQVRKGLKHCEVAVLTDIEPHLEPIREINMSQAERFAQLREPQTYLPPSYYRDQAEEWRNDVRKSFGNKGQVWWGAFCSGRLGAYVVCINVDGVCSIAVTKSDSEAQEHCCIDALYYTILRSAAADPRFVRIINGGPTGARASLNDFKKQFLFKPTTIPCYTSSPRLLSVARTVASLQLGIRSWVHGLRRV